MTRTVKIAQYTVHFDADKMRVTERCSENWFGVEHFHNVQRYSSDRPAKTKRSKYLALIEEAKRRLAK